jgi:hypothetical protein
MKRAAPVVLILLASCAPPIVSGLMPIEPAPDNSRTGSVRPLLRWEPMPDGDDPRITDLVYDVQILDSAGWLLSERAGLTSCEYQVEAPLEYAHAYFWTVRARFRWEGRRRETEWSRLSDPAERLATLAVPAPKYLPFRTPEKK